MSVRFVAALVVCATISVSAFAKDDIAKGEKETIFIGKVIVKPSLKEAADKAGTATTLDRVSEAFESQLISALSATRVFQIVERKRKDDLEAEQAYAAVAVDPSDKRAAKALKMTGAKYAFLPQVDGFEDKVQTQSFESLGTTTTTHQMFFSALVQIVDTTTGELLPDAPTVQLTQDQINALQTAGMTAGSEQAVVAIAKAMAVKLSQGAVALLRPAKILAITGKQVLINRGIDAGFVKGAEVEIYASQDVKDEDSGEVFKNEVAVGRGVLTRSDGKQAFAQLEGQDLGIAKGCVVRVIVKNSDVMSAAETENVAVTPGSSEKPLSYGGR
jgi:curli biogenesis system outer membrane secretion channel CsgG